MTVLVLEHKAEFKKSVHKIEFFVVKSGEKSILSHYFFFLQTANFHNKIFSCCHTHTDFTLVSVCHLISRISFLPSLHNTTNVRSAHVGCYCCGYCAYVLALASKSRRRRRRRRRRKSDSTTRWHLGPTVIMILLQVFSTLNMLSKLTRFTP